MNRARRTAWLWTGAVAAALTWAVAGVFAGREALRGVPVEIRASQTALEALAAQAERLAAFRQARAIFEDLETADAPTFETLLRDRLGEVQPQEWRTVSTAPLDGWTHRQVEVSFARAPLARVMAFVSDCEAQRPPWRLEKCVVKAVSPQGQDADVVLSLAGLIRNVNQDGTLSPPR